MARLFWVGTGVVLTVVVLVKGRQLVLRYAPAAVVDRASESAQATGAAVGSAASHFLADFRAARDERATELSEALLASTQGTVEDLRAQRDRTAGARGSAGTDRATRERYAPLVDDDADEDELGYSF